MITYLHYTQGTTIINEDGEYSGYDSDRRDELINAEITFPYGIHNVRIYLGKYNVVIKYKYISYEPITGILKIGNKGDDNFSTERKHISYLNEIFHEIEEHGTINGQHINRKVLGIINALQ
ncbi:hypothetical protein PGO54_12320 [Klebsiella aerogenes]